MTEYDANLALTPKDEPSWVKPSICKRARPIPWYTRLWMWFKHT